MSTTNINIFILDDDTVFLDKFKEHLRTHLTAASPYSFTVSSFPSKASMLEAARTSAPNLLIADIDLHAESNGIQAAEELLTFAPKCGIIYLTAFLSYATDIFGTDPLYFILKDEYEKRLPDAIGKFLESYKKTRLYIQARSGGVKVTVPISSILYCEHNGKNVHIYCTDGTYTIRSSISGVFNQLPKDQFAMCHKSFIVNLANVQRVTQLKVTLSNNTEINVSRTYCAAFRQAHSRWISALL